MIDQTTIERVLRVLLSEAPKGSEVILFGSYARGQGGADSDLDLLVIEPHVVDRRTESVRLRAALRALRVPVDVLVVSRDAFESWKRQPNNIIYEAAREGRSYVAA